MVVSERRARGKGGDTEVRTIQLAKVDGSRATYEALLTQTPEGDYKFWLSQPTAPSPKPRAECRVLAPPGEIRGQPHHVQQSRHPVLGLTPCG